MSRGFLAPLRVITLQHILADWGQPVSGRKSLLLERVLAVMSTTAATPVTVSSPITTQASAVATTAVTAAISAPVVVASSGSSSSGAGAPAFSSQWAIFTQPCLLRYAQSLGLAVDAQWPFNQLCMFLDAIPQLSAQGLLQLNAAGAGAQQSPSGIARHKPPAQGPEQSLPDYTQALDCHFSLVSLSPAEQIAAFLQGVRPDYQQHIVSAVSQGRHSYVEVRDHLLQQFGKSPLDHLAAFHVPKPRDMRFAEWAIQLVSTYHQYVGTATGTSSLEVSQTVDKRVVEHLYLSCSLSLRSRMASFLQENPDTPPVEFGRHMDLCLTTPGTQLARTGSSVATCSIHGARGHTDQQCKQQHPELRRQGASRRDGSSQQPVKCFKCYKLGHTAANCPTNHQGN